jgi:hypothetical protein
MTTRNKVFAFAGLLAAVAYSGIAGLAAGWWEGYDDGMDAADAEWQACSKAAHEEGDGAWCSLPPHRP